MLDFQRSTIQDGKSIDVKTLVLTALISLPFGPCGAILRAQQTPLNGCPRPAQGIAVPEPADLHSHDGLLKVDLTIRSESQTNGSVRYCYFDSAGHQSPNLRLKPGDLLVLNLKNDLIATNHVTSGHVHAHNPVNQNPCVSGAMTGNSTNLHFHGLTIAPICHQDDVLKTSLSPGDPPFEYRFRIPANQPPGLYWYHPHIHGFTAPQVLGGASGALIIEGIESTNKEVAGLPERVLIIRDQALLNPDAPPSRSEPVVPKNLIDRDGDAGNNGTGFGKPAKDLSINFVPVPYPDYTPALIKMKPGERQFWRVLNASAVTYLNLAVVVKGKPMPLGLVALDGVPLNENGSSGRFCFLANPSWSAPWRPRRVHFGGASAWDQRSSGHASRGHRTGR